MLEPHLVEVLETGVQVVAQALGVEPAEVDGGQPVVRGNRLGLQFLVPELDDVAPDVLRERLLGEVGAPTDLGLDVLG